MIRQIIKFSFIGETSKDWFLKYGDNWKLYTALEEVSTVEVIIPDKIASRIFTKGMNNEEAITQSQIIGKRDLGLIIFDMNAVMA